MGPGRNGGDSSWSTGRRRRKSNNGETVVLLREAMTDGQSEMENENIKPIQQTLPDHRKHEQKRTTPHRSPRRPWRIG